MFSTTNLQHQKVSGPMGSYRHVTSSVPSTHFPVIDTVSSVLTSGKSKTKRTTSGPRPASTSFVMHVLCIQFLITDPVCSAFRPESDQKAQSTGIVHFGCITTNLVLDFCQLSIASIHAELPLYRSHLNVFTNVSVVPVGP